MNFLPCFAGEVDRRVRAEMEGVAETAKSFHRRSHPFRLATLGTSPVKRGRKV
jgi:hypothetical protein